ncbi:MAG TPA: S8 family serine peptidase [Intrasporangium sp.]|uniref:S8 family serine peptidase n=1 Tax=Intrasporangium sp. TaxID=1925024 RepID=UPI002B4670BB|nr:S8 family serine peptidase [Intrasporangium sp.]HKX67891.1 S8 family serine peptidase [Intrasporangium sp.]
MLTQASRRRRRRTVAVVGAAVVVGGLTLPPTAAVAEPTAQPASQDKLGDHDRSLLASYAAKARTRSVLPGSDRPVPNYATLIIASKDGTAPEVKRELTALGIEVTGGSDSVGYVQANVPFGSVDAVAAIDDVVAIDVDELLPYEPTAPTKEALAPVTPDGSLPKAPSGSTPDDNPYLPTGETGSAKFKAQNPTYDGRGTTIGIMDSGIDPTHPALTTTTTGEAKLVDTVVGTSSRNLIDSLFDDTWRYLSNTAKVSGPTFTDPLRGETWTGPASSDLRVSVRKVNVGGLLGTDLGVLYRDSDHAVWVDTDQDHDFTDEQLMKPFSVDRQIGHLGTDDPATPLNERVPFTIDFEFGLFPTSSTCGEGGCVGVNINTLVEGHGTHVAGIAAANGLFGGSMDGQAPGAKLVSMRACHALGCSTAALTEGMVELAENYGVDVINMSIGSAPQLNDGMNARALLYNRIIDETGVQIFISAGNSGAGSNTVGDPSVAADVVSVGASVSKETWWANYGSATEQSRDIMPFSSRGPREDGGFKPDLTAPGSAVSSLPNWLEGGAPAETGYTLPVGSAMFNGTSMAAPQATGAAAVLLSAAKQSGIALTPKDLRNALFTSASYNDAIPAVAQGRGALEVRGAWTRIAQGSLATDDVTVQSPVCTRLSHQLVTPHSGGGLYNSCAPGQGGQSVGESRTYEVTLTRTSGSDKPVVYPILLDGNDGTFTVPEDVKLAKGVPTVIEVTANTVTPGVHSAVLRLDNPMTKAVEKHVMLSVTAAEPLTVGSTWSVDGEVRRNQTVTYTVAVPAGTTSLTVNLSGLAADSQTRWWAFRPEGVSGEAKSQGTVYCYAGYLEGNGCNPVTRTYNNPVAGVWELVVESRRTSPMLDNPYHLEATITQ